LSRLALGLTQPASVPVQGCTLPFLLCWRIPWERLLGLSFAMLTAVHAPSWL
jgi:hypothetical protein